MKKIKIIPLSLLIFGIPFLTSCISSRATTAASFTSTPTITPRQDHYIKPTHTLTLPPSPQVLPSPTVPIPDTGWVEIEQGLEQRVLNLFDDNGMHLEEVFILRVNPEEFSFDIKFDPSAKTVEEWQLQTKSRTVFNGGFFRIESERYFPNGLMIVEGETFGISYRPFAGMLTITDGNPDLRWLNDRPIEPSESFQAGLQSFPVLVKPGGILGFPKEAEDYETARRSVIGLTRDGSFLFMMTTKDSFTLHGLSIFLIETDFDLDIALNLDGGPSSGLSLSSPPILIPSYVPIPVVIVVDRR